MFVSGGDDDVDDVGIELAPRAKSSEKKYWKLLSLYHGKAHILRQAILLHRRMRRVETEGVVIGEVSEAVSLRKTGSWYQCQQRRGR